MIHWASLDAGNICIAEGRHDGSDLPDPTYMDVTGRDDGPQFMGRTYNARTDSWSARPADPVDPLDSLRAKDPATWSDEDRSRALQFLIGG